MIVLIFAFLANFIVWADMEGPLGSVDLAQNPTPMQWSKIDTDHFEIIFPNEIESEAQRVAHLLEKVYPFVSRSLEVYPPKISVILQNQSVVSNGFVTLAPRRSEWFTTPAYDPELSNTEWMKTLAVHEFRHVVQFEKSRQNFNSYFEWFLGEYGQAIGIGISFPNWYLEGDAVGIETALTYGGRGRLPLFERDLRTLLLSGKDFNFEKAHLGSFKDYVPNHYVYGYFLTSNLRNTEGDLFLSKLSDETTKKGYNPLTFYNAYTKITGKSFEAFYHSTTQDLIRLWQEKLALIKPTPYIIKNLKDETVWTNYHSPQALKDGGVFALKRGLSHYTRFVVIKNKKEKVILYPGPMQGDYPIKVRNNRFAYVEWELDPRWGYRDFSRVKVFDLKKKEHVLDLRQTKARMAVVNFRGDQVLYVDWSKDFKQSIVVVNMKGQLAHRIDYPADKVITSIDWLNEQSVVMVLKGRDDQKMVVKFDLEKKSEELLLPPDYVNLGFITCQDEKILLESPSSGIDNIYLLSEGKLKQLTSSKFGAYAPSLANSKLLYNEYTADGMQIAEKSIPWDEEQVSKDSFVPVYKKMAETEKRHELEQAFFEKKNYESRTYSQLKNALNFHSWLLLAPPLTATVTLAAISRDLLNKFSLSFGGLFDINERKSHAFVSSTWSHLYPLFDLNAIYGGRRQDLYFQGKKIENEWEEGVFEAGMQIPWRLISGRFTHQFKTRAFSKLIKVTNKMSNDFSDITDGALHSPGVDISYSIYSRQAYRDIYPEWGTSLSSHFEEGKDITGTGQEGALFEADGIFYAPGLFAHHSFFQQLAYEKQRDDSYQYASFVQRPRGTRSFFLEEYRKYSANYLMPIFYPDWNFSRYFYYKRISSNLFYDELNGRLGTYQYKAASYGWELLSDFHVLRISLPFTIGIRGNYIISGYERNNNYEFFLASSPFQF